MVLQLPPKIWRRGGTNPMQYRPSLYLSADRGVYQDAAVQFTAADKSALYIPDASQTGLNLGTDDGIICGWFWFDSLPSFASLIEKGSVSTGSSALGYWLFLKSTGSLTLCFGDAIDHRTNLASAAGVVQTGKWHFISIVFDRSSNAVLKVDGKPEITMDVSAFGGDAQSPRGLTIGAQNMAQANFFDGRIDSLMFFKKPDLSPHAADIIAWAYNSGAGRLCAEITPEQKAAWGAVSGWEHLEGAGTRYDSWGSNHLTQQFGTLATNGDFTTDATDWTASGATLASVAGGQAGNCLEVKNSGDAAGYAHQAFTTTVGKLYTLTAYHKNGTSTGKILIGTAAGGSQNHAGTAQDDAAWAQKTVTFRATGATTYVSLSLATATADQTTLWDTVSLTAAEIQAAPGIVRGVARDSNFAVQLNGTNQYLLYTGTAFDPGTGDFSVGCAFYLDSLPPRHIEHSVILAGAGTSTAECFYVALDPNGTFRPTVAAGGKLVRLPSSAAAKVGQWNTAVATFDRDGNCQLAFNGTTENLGSLATVAGSIAPGNFTLGRNPLSASYYTPGRIDNAFYANRLLTPAEIAYLHNNGAWRQWAEIAADQPSLAAAMKGFWEFDDKAALGTDSTPNANHLTPQNTPTQGMGVNYLAGVVSRWEDQSRNSKHGTITTLSKRPAYLSSGINSRPVIRGDGVDDYLGVPAISLTGGFAISAVLRCAANPSALTVLGKDANNYIALTDNTTVTVRIAGGTATAFTVPAIGTGAHILTVTRDAANAVNVYLDGAVSTTGAKTLAGTLAVEQVMAHGSEYFAGDIADVLVYDGEKTAAELARLHTYLARRYGITI